MKKQILLLTFLVLAIIAGTSNSFGQGAVNYSDPQALSCTPDALHPIAGQPFTYSATASVPGTFRFYATKDPDFIQTDGSGNTTYNFASALTTPTDLIATSTNYNTADAATSVDITWSSDILANTDYQGTPGATPSPTFVAAYFEAADGCSDNFKVYELDPLNGFTVDVLAIDPDAVTTAPAYGTVPTTCSDIVRGASYTGGAMEYDYGQNYLYFEFVAANFTNYWIPTFALSGTDGVQSVTYEYTYELPSAWDASTTWAPLVSGTTNLAVASSVTNTSTGVSTFVRVTIDHANYENINSQTLTMTVDGENASGEWDVVNSTCADPGAADSNDTADATIDARPEITPGTSSTTSPNTTIVSGDEQN